MKRVFAFLTDYLIKKGLVQEEDRPIYEYGFQILIEIFLLEILRKMRIVIWKYTVKRD